MTFTDITSQNLRVGRSVLTGIGLLCGLLAACTTPDLGLPPTTAPTATLSATPAPASALADTEWHLVSMNGDDLLAGTQITLRFDGETLGGSAGCNTYGGGYSASVGGIQVSDLYATEMACVAPEGVMVQEQAYLEGLRAATTYDLEAGQLILTEETGDQRLVYAAPDSPSAPVAEATPTSPAEPDPTATPDPETSVGIQHVVDKGSGVSLLVPVEWTVIEPGPQGHVTILQSYPEDKYIGGEGREPGDTKCDLTVHPPGVSVADVIAQVRSDPMTTILAEEEMVLRSGQTGVRMELDSLGPARVLYTELDGHAVVLICFGDLEPFDEIAVTLEYATPTQ